jgi:hypothetical protein
MTEEDQLVQLCQRLGASEGQARVMAQQFLKRAEQLVSERGMSRMEAMSHLLKLLTEGRLGRTVRGFEGSPK